jgi:hypothetical protein
MAEHKEQNDMPKGAGIGDIFHVTQPVRHDVKRQECSWCAASNQGISSSARAPPIIYMVEPDSPSVSIEHLKTPGKPLLSSYHVQAKLWIKSTGAVHSVCLGDDDGKKHAPHLTLVDKGPKALSLVVVTPQEDQIDINSWEVGLIRLDRRL